MLPLKSHLPPGPWTAKGNKVVDGYGRTIATIFWPYNAALVAQWVAELPTFIEFTEQSDQIEKLKADLAAAQKEIAELEAQIGADPL